MCCLTGGGGTILRYICWDPRRWLRNPSTCKKVDSTCPAKPLSSTCKTLNLGLHHRILRLCGPPTMSSSPEFKIKNLDFRINSKQVEFLRRTKNSNTDLSRILYRWVQMTMVPSQCQALPEIVSCVLLYTWAQMNRILEQGQTLPEVCFTNLFYSCAQMSKCFRVGEHNWTGTQNEAQPVLKLKVDFDVFVVQVSSHEQDPQTKPSTS
jgi:hypothetical protein